MPPCREDIKFSSRNSFSHDYDSQFHKNGQENESVFGTNNEIEYIIAKERHKDDESAGFLSESDLENLNGTLIKRSEQRDLEVEVPISNFSNS